MQFKKGTSEVLAAPVVRAAPDMVDYRKRCVVTKVIGPTGHNCVVYGVTAAEYNAAMGTETARGMKNYGRKTQ